MVALNNMINGALTTGEFIAQAEKFILTLPQLPIHPVHRFSDGLYIREQLFPANSAALGFEHRGECLNIVLFGHARVFVDDQVREVRGPAMFNSGPGIQKVGVFVTDTLWINIHPNPDNCRDLATIEDRIYRKSEAHMARQREHLNHLN